MDTFKRLQHKGSVIPNEEGVCSSLDVQFMEELLRSRPIGWISISEYCRRALLMIG